MDRRSTIAALLGKNRQTKGQSSSKLMMQEAPVVLSGLEPYSGAWGFDQAAHLLRRATFGPKYAQFKEGETLGLQALLDKLFAVELPEEGPIYSGFLPVRNGTTAVDDPYLNVGDPWAVKINGVWKVGQIDRTDQASFQLINLYRRLSLRSWKMERMLKEGSSLLETMTLFWNNHFVTADINEATIEFRYITTLQENALGNFRELTKRVTLDPAMLLYLNGNENTNRAPNENYARELFELFAIGKGPLVGPGDYTNYTELDIQEAAKVLTGWRVRRQLPDTNGLVDFENENISVFQVGAHDRTVKNFSPRFNNASITNGDDQEYKALIDMIFAQAECARFIARKLYRWFVYYMIDDTIEQNVIEPMAQLIIDNDYEIAPALRALFGSQHFFDHINQGPMIKNPIDFVASTLRPFGFEERDPQNFVQKQIYYLNAASYFDDMQMVYFAPPDVAGWKAYYQEPSFYRTWINSSTLIARSKFTNQLAMGVNDNGRPSQYRLNVLGFVAGLDDPMDVNLMLDEFVKILYPRALSQEQKDYLKGVLLPGLPDYEWPLEYGQYLANPDDADLRDAVETKLRTLVNVMLSLPEFYLS
ncbi:MAG: DUF1800 domain-containing protein [Saprospiraceae bacterium]|nr:DUF1800 domain-containing protein [Saprospiraceae bacterium]